MPDSRPPSAQAAAPGVATPPPASDAATQPAQQGLVDHIPRLFGRYRIIDRIGRGGMGAVFRAHDTQLDRVVALKVPFLGDDGGDARQRFYREARAAATLHHPNVCPVYDVGEFRGMPFLTMALVEGKGLDRVLKDTPLAPPHAAALVRKLALAMQVAHDRGVVHRDLKPSNVLIRADGEPVIMDFGLARRAGDQASEGLTRRGDVIGTIEYMPPEQLDGDNDAVGPAADVYALGVLMYEVLTGRRPFTGTAAQLLAAILVKAPPRPSDARPGIPERLDEICLKAMARQPADRFATMSAFAAALTDFLRSARPGTTPPATQPAESAPAARPSAPTRPVEVTVVSQGSDRGGRKPFEVVEPEPEPQPATPSSGRRKRNSARRRPVQKSSKKPVIIGAAVLAVVAVVVGVIALRPSRPAPTSAPQVASTDPPPAPPVKQATPPSSQPAVVPAPAAKSAAAPKGTTTPKRPPAATPAANPGVRVKPAEVSLAVGEKREVAIEIDRAGYRGPLSVRVEAPPEVRFAPGGPITVRADGPNPVITLMLTAEPAGGPVRVGITATPTEGEARKPLNTSVTVRPTPGPCIRILDVGGPDDSVGTMALTPDASLALVGGDKIRREGDGPAAKSDAGAIRAWDLARGRPLTPLTGHTGPVTGLVVSADGKAALSSSADETVALWDLAQGRRASQSPKQPLKMLAAAVSPDAKRGLVAYPGLIVKTDLEKFHAAGHPIKTAQLPGLESPEAVLAVAVSGDRKGLVGGIDGKLYVIDMTDKSKPKPLTGLKEAVRAAAFSATPAVAATGSGGVLRVGKVQPGRENTVSVWDTASGSLQWRADEHTSPVVCVAFSADGRLLASGDERGEVRVWGAADGQPVGTFAGHAGRVFALAFSPDGKTLLSGSADRTVRTWRLP